MRWPDWLVLITIGALLGGAYFPLARSLRLVSQAGEGRAYHDTYYVVAHFHYLAGVAALVGLAVAAYAFVLRRASRWFAGLGAINVAGLSGGLVMTLYPQVVLGRQGMPRRYIDYPEAFERLAAISTIGAGIAASAMLALIALTLRALWRQWRRNA